MKTELMLALPYFVPEAFGKIGGVTRKALKINKIDGAGRGS